MKTLVIDIETTGIPAKGAEYATDFMTFPRIVGIAWKYNGSETEHFIINQGGRPIEPETTAIHGITDAMAAESPHTLEVVLALLVANTDPDRVIGHNIYFDTSIIKANVLRLIAEGKMTQGVFDEVEKLLHKDRRIDTMRKGIKHCGVGAYPKLSVLYSKLFNEEHKGHTAKADVDATHRCYVKMVEMGLI